MRHDAVETIVPPAPYVSAYAAYPGHLLRHVRVVMARLVPTAFTHLCHCQANQRHGRRRGHSPPVMARRVPTECTDLRNDRAICFDFNGLWSSMRRYTGF